MDFDTLVGGTTFTLQISVADPDQSGSNSPTELTISVYDVNDNAPQFTPSQIAVAFDENEPEGLSVATFAASDPDTGTGGIFRLDNRKIVEYKTKFD